MGNYVACKNYTKKEPSGFRKFSEHPFLINCKNLCRYRDTYSADPRQVTLSNQTDVKLKLYQLMVQRCPEGRRGKSILQHCHSSLSQHLKLNRN